MKINNECHECVKRTTCEKSCHPENYKLSGCAEFVPAASKKQVQNTIEEDCSKT